MTTCPICHGKRGRIIYACPGFRQVHIPCATCEATGVVTEARAAELAMWQQQGAAMRTKRIEQRISMQDVAAEHGITAAEYSQIEFGLAAAPWL